MEQTKSKFLLMLFTFFVSSCWAVDTANPQPSFSILESKKMKVFIKEFYAKTTLPDEIIIQEAWIEKGSYNVLKNSIVQREIEDWCQLCFTMKQIPSSRFLAKNVLDWQIEESPKEEYVGIRIKTDWGKVSEVYSFSMPEEVCQIPDSIKFNLFTGSKREKNLMFVGTLTFYPKD